MATTPLLENPSTTTRRGSARSGRPQRGSLRPRPSAPLFAALVLASGAAHCGSITSTAVATFTEPKAYYLGSGDNLTYPIFSDGDSASIGDIVGGVGASAKGSVSASLTGRAEAFWFPYYSFAFSSSNQVNVSWNGDLNVGESFFVSTAAAPLTWGKVHLVDPGFQGSVGLAETLSASASAKGCLGGCVELSVWAKLAQSQTLASIVGDKGNVDLLVLGQKVADVLPYSYTSSDNTLKLNVGAPDFSATLAGAGSVAPVSHTSEQLLLQLGVDVAQLIANLVGLPVPLSGSVGGFGYTLLEAVVALGADLKRWFELAASQLHTSLTFSAPVEVLEGGVWSAPKTSFTPEAGVVYEVRPVQASKTLGITPWYGLFTELDASLELVPFASASVRALEVYGHGVSFGPLLDESVKGALAHLELDSTDVTRSYWMTGKPINLDFDPLVADINGLPVDLCANPADCLYTGFIPTTTELTDGWRSDAIVRATQLVGPCLLGIPDGNLFDCGIDPDFVPLRVDFRLGPSPNDPVEFTPSYRDLLAILERPDLVSGPESNVAMLAQGLRELIGPDLYDNGLPRRAPEGEPPPTEPIVGNPLYEIRIGNVPEPGVPILLAIGALTLVLVRANARALRAGPPDVREAPR